MIDLHSHVLPNIDDGSGSAEETTAMLGLWRSFGFQRVAASHHLSGELAADYQRRIVAATASIGPQAQRMGIELVSGFEILLDPRLPERLGRGEPLSLGGSRAVLVELPFLSWPSYAEEVLFALQLGGYRPILAHPERYDAVQHDLSLATSVAERGVVLQLTFASLTGALGPAPKKTAERLIGLDLPIILASDAHSDGQRLLAIPEALKRAERSVGAERLRQLTTETPQALLADQALPDLAPVEASGQASNRFRLRRR
ncbi:MAG: CpsB/CapC family capsule biosynthesis tyrosine phosphatase [Thermomicrobiales bacterium]